VSFLRPENTFLSQALKHPSATFLLFNNLDPLVHAKNKLAYRKYADVKDIIGDDPFHQSEEDTIAQYNSSLYIPQIIFLGLDERQSGFEYKGRYKGQPWFAVDITPKASVKEAAEKLVESLKAEGLDFNAGRMNMSLPAEEGTSNPNLSRFKFMKETHEMLTKQCSCHIRRSPPPPRLERAQPLLRLLRLQNPLHKRWIQTHMPAQRHRIRSFQRRRTSSLRDPHRYLEPLFPPHRPHSHHGRRLRRRQKDPARTPKALATVLVLHLSRIPRTC
jgi:hypothetical protein